MQRGATAAALWRRDDAVEHARPDPGRTGPIASVERCAAPVRAAWPAARRGRPGGGRLRVLARRSGRRGLALTDSLGARPLAPPARAKSDRRPGLVRERWLARRPAAVPAATVRRPERVVLASRECVRRFLQPGPERITGRDRQSPGRPCRNASSGPSSVASSAGSHASNESATRLRTDALSRLRGCTIVSRSITCRSGRLWKRLTSPASRRPALERPRQSTGPQVRSVRTRSFSRSPLSSGPR